MRKIISPLLLGILAGAIAVSLFHASTMEQLYWEKEKLRVELFETTERLQKIESLWEEHQEGDIRSVSIQLNDDLNAFTALALRQALTEISSGLVGEPVENVDYELILALFHQRKLSVEEKDYLITVNWAFIAREAVINLTAVPAGE